MTDKPNVLVLGATGKVGGAVVNQLVDNENVNVIAVAQESSIFNYIYHEKSLSTRMENSSARSIDKIF